MAVDVEPVDVSDAHRRPAEVARSHRGSLETRLEERRTLEVLRTGSSRHRRILLVAKSSLAASGVFAIAVLATAFTRSPVAVHVISYVKRHDAEVVTHPRYRRVAAHVTAAWGICELGVSFWEARHLSGTSSAEFVAIRSFVGWPIMAFVVFWLIFYVRARLDPLEYRLRSAVAYDSA